MVPDSNESDAWVPPNERYAVRIGLHLGENPLVDDIGPPPPAPLPSLPLGVGIIGGICFLGSVIFAIASLSLWLRGVSESVGDRTTPVPSAAVSYINLSPFESDEFGQLCENLRRL